MRTPDPRSGAFERAPAATVGRRRRIGVVLGAAAAAVVSAGLVYWISSGEDHALSGASGAAGQITAPAPVIHAPVRPDAEQVARAYEQLQETYADQGTRGVADFSRSCAESLRADPGMLDFCLAFDIYANALEGDDAAARAGQGDGGARDLALARSVLPPGVDPAARLDQVRALARQASVEPPSAAKPQTPPVAAPPGEAVRVHAARATPRRSGAPAACRLRATAAQRMVCASPALRSADRRLRLTYRHALAAGISPRRLARDQARFRASVNAAGADRAAVARLYHSRTRALEALIRRARRPVD